MRNWLIRALGGCTLQTWEDTQKENARIIGARDAEIGWLRQAVLNEQERVNHLQDVIFKKFGIVQPEFTRQPDPNPHPINLTRAPWGKQRKKLEDADLKRHLDSLERQYHGRSVPMPPGDSPSADGREHVPTSSAMGD